MLLPVIIAGILVTYSLAGLFGMSTIGPNPGGLIGLLMGALGGGVTQPDAYGTAELNNGGGSWFASSGANQIAEDTRVLSSNSGLGTSVDIIIEQFMNVGDYVECFSGQKQNGGFHTSERPSMR